MKYPWIAWYAGEYISKTRRLTMAQHGAYMLLLWEYYINGPIEANANSLLAICCGKTSEDEVDINYVLERFFHLEDGFWRHHRADEEIEKRVSVSEKRKLVGRKGGLAKATNLLKQKATQSQSQSQLQEPKATTKARCAFEIPTWVPQEAWNHYEEMRQKIRKPMTDQARKWAVNQLARLRDEGQVPAVVLEQSVFNSWQGLFPVRSDYDRHPKPEGQRRVSAQHERAANNLAAAAAAFGGSDMDAFTAGNSSRQTTRLSKSSAPLLEGEVKGVS